MTFLIGFLDATSEIFFMVSPLAVVQVDSFSKFVLTQAIFVAPTLYN